MEKPSVLAFERKIDPSDALFYATTWEKRMEKGEPIKLCEKRVRGTISNRKTNDTDPAKLNADIAKPNLQFLDCAALPPECDTLQVYFSARILGGFGKPTACNNLEYTQKLLDITHTYCENTGCAELARRYAFSLASGRFLWRNRISSEMVEVTVKHMVAGKVQDLWTFNALDFDMSSFDAVPEQSKQGIDALAQCIAKTLRSDSDYTLLEVAACARMGKGLEVFPSQEFIQKNGKESKGKTPNEEKEQKSKTLYAVQGIAAMHSQKVGNALRTIDTWYPESNGKMPIALEPYGSVTSQAHAYRHPKGKNDFYTLRDNWMLKDIQPSEEQQHFVMGILIRGGVFGESGKD